MFRRILVIGCALVVTLSGVPTMAMAGSRDQTTVQDRMTTFAEVAWTGAMVAEHSPARARWVRIRSLYGNQDQCLDADNNGGGNGTKVQVWRCSNDPQQRWFYSNDFQLENARFPAMCLDADVHGGGADGTKVQLWRCNREAQQRWHTYADDLAIYNSQHIHLKNVVLDRDINLQGDGAKVQLWRKNFQPQQWWRIETIA